MRYVKPEMDKKMSIWLKKGIKNYADEDLFRKTFGVSSSYARLMYKHPTKARKKK